MPSALEFILQWMKKSQNLPVKTIQGSLRVTFLRNILARISSDGAGIISKNYVSYNVKSKMYFY